MVAFVEKACQECFETNIALLIRKNDRWNRLGCQQRLRVFSGERVRTQSRYLFPSPPPPSLPLPRNPLGRNRILEGFSPNKAMLEASTRELLEERRQAFEVLEELGLLPSDD